MTPPYWEYSFRKVLSKAINEQEETGSVNFTKIIEEEDLPYGKDELLDMLKLATSKGIIDTDLVTQCK